MSVTFWLVKLWPNLVPDIALTLGVREWVEPAMMLLFSHVILCSFFFSYHKSSIWCLQISTFRTRQQALPICERLRLRLLRLPGRKDTRQQSHDSHTPCCYGNKMLAILYGLLREDKKTTVTCQIISHSANNVATATHNTNKRVCTAIVDITEFMTDNSTVLRSRWTRCCYRYRGVLREVTLGQVPRLT